MVQNLWSLSSSRTTTIAMLFLFLMDRVLRNKSVDFDHAILSKHCVRVFSCIVESLDHAEDEGFSLLTMLPESARPRLKMRAGGEHIDGDGDISSSNVRRLYRTGLEKKKRCFSLARCKTESKISGKWGSRGLARGGEAEGIRMGVSVLPRFEKTPLLIGVPDNNKKSQSVVHSVYRISDIDDKECKYTYINCGVFLDGSGIQSKTQIGMWSGIAGSSNEKLSSPPLFEHAVDLVSLDSTMEASAIADILESDYLCSSKRECAHPVGPQTDNEAREIGLEVKIE
jgi:hypothetical protein